ncbi:hypothetical protein ANO14919_002350 [Xylariales sp. No.14919]|nr:hypothetical protein F5X98DRAFT_211760 [Xylaria grammica]GAW10899.1 hypothetical protein ANO14919_002350 [Xylariales sp. No.14919]
MSFSHALQSLVFYVASCSPCHQAVHQHRLKKQAKKQREERQAEQAELGGYQQPEPFATNPYWQEEINMGPHIVRKQYKSPSMRHLTSAGGDTVSIGGGSIAANNSINAAKKAATWSSPRRAKSDPTDAVKNRVAVNNDVATTSAATRGKEKNVITNSITDTPTKGKAKTTIAPLTKKNLAAISRPAKAKDSDSWCTVSSAEGSTTRDGSATGEESAITAIIKRHCVENEKPNASMGRNTIVTVTNLNHPSPIRQSVHRRASPAITEYPHVPHNWNHRRYQREDEELWGSEWGHKLMDVIKHASTSAGRLIESSLSKDAKRISDEEEEEANSYFKQVNPPVNDYHPPIISRAPLKRAVKWMVQPPPPAKVMDGKIPVSRGNSISSSSRSILRR